MLADIVYFPKKCPKCSYPMRVVKKFGGYWWYECCNTKCQHGGPNVKDN